MPADIRPLLGRQHFVGVLGLSFVLLIAQLLTACDYLSSLARQIKSSVLQPYRFAQEHSLSVKRLAIWIGRRHNLPASRFLVCHWLLTTKRVGLLAPVA